MSAVANSDVVDLIDSTTSSDNDDTTATQGAPWAAHMQYGAALNQASVGTLPIVPAAQPLAYNNGYRCSEELAIMLLDVEDAGGGGFHLWGLTPGHRTVLLRVPDFEPCFFLPTPVRSAVTHVVDGMPKSIGQATQDTAGAATLVPSTESSGAGSCREMQGAACGAEAVPGRGNDSNSHGATTATGDVNHPDIGHAGSSTCPGQPDIDAAGDGTKYCRGGRGGSDVCWHVDELLQLQALMNARLPSDCQVQRLALTPNLRHIMYYRPAAPEGSAFLRLHLRPGGNARKAGNMLADLAKKGAFLSAGFRFTSPIAFEHEVKPLTRFLCDASLSGTSWVYVPPAPATDVQAATASVPHDAATAGYRQISPAQRVSLCDLELWAPWRSLQPLTPDATQLADPTWCPEVVRSLAGDAHSGLQQPALAADKDPPTTRAAAIAACTTLPPAAAARSGLKAAITSARGGDIVQLKVATLDVQMVPRDMTARVPLPESGDPIVCIACSLAHTLHAAAAPIAGDGGTCSTAADAVDSGGGGHGGSRFDGGRGTRATSGRDQRVVFVLAGAVTADLCEGGAKVRCFGSEAALLEAWRAWLVEADPDVLACYQVRDTLGALQHRFAALRIDGGGLFISRLDPGTATGSKSNAGNTTCMAVPLKVESVVMYSAAWVKQQARMAGTSNQETFRAELAGRLVFDLLRQVLTSQSLASFSLVDCVQSVLGETLEVLSPLQLAALWGQAQAPHSSTGIAAQAGAAAAACGTGPGHGPGHGRSRAGAATPPATPPPSTRKRGRQGRGTPSGGATSTDASFLARRTQEHVGRAPCGGSASTAFCSLGCEAATLPPRSAVMRLARYGLRRVAAVAQLMAVLATVPEAFEMARVTGLTVPQVMYNATMIRTWSLLLRNARRHGYLVGGRTDAGQLIESPFLLHPIENRTAALYRQPVATLDFASLYPSLYQAHNLCYSTLVHPDDVAMLGGRDAPGLFFSPSGHAFVRPDLRKGILPTILAALITARSRTRELLKQATSAATAAVAAPASTNLDEDDNRPAAAADVLVTDAGHATTSGNGTQPEAPLMAASVLPKVAPGAPAPSLKALAAQRAVLDSRQKALKLAANALYGFTGSQASPLQCVPLADSCLALGAAATRRAISMIGQMVMEGRLGPAAEEGRVIYAQTDSVFVVFPKAANEQAVMLGKQAAALVSLAMPPPMELKFEKVMQPFLLLHVNRYAGRAFETEKAAASKQGTLVVKGVKSLWRQSAPIVRDVLQVALKRIIMHEDVLGAVKYAEEQIHRLLSGHVEVSELIMTGGLWRVTGQQLGAAAAATEAPPPDEEVRGPHANLAVKLLQRDPGRKFVLGERLQYVLLAGSRLQDDAAEDPLLVGQLGLSPALELYWKNKLLTPLAELYGMVLPPAQLHTLLHGPHTLVRVDALAAGEVGAPGGAPGSTPPSAKSGGGARQRGLMQFFKQTARCLGCRQALPSNQPGLIPLKAAGGEDDISPGLCEHCSKEPRRWQDVYLATLQEECEAAVALASATSMCSQCHSGGLLGPIACENGECRVLYKRLGAARRVAGAGLRLRRLALSEPW